MSGKVLEIPYRKDLVKMANSFLCFVSRVLEQAQRMNGDQQSPFFVQFQPMLGSLGTMAVQLLKDVIFEFSSAQFENCVKVNQDSFFVKQLIQKMLKVASDHGKSVVGVDQNLLGSIAVRPSAISHR